jgi:anaerobic selenocysteine-containing dehydrogenase
MSESAELSDFVLPLASPLETLTVAEPLPLGQPFLAAALPAVKPGSSCRSFDEWLTLLAAAINGSAPPLTPERFAAQAVLGNTSGKLAADRAIYVVESESKQLEADMPALISSLRTLISRVPQLPESRVPFEPEQYLLTTFEESVQGPVTAPSKWLNEITYSPKVYLHPQRARRLGVGNGDRVILTGGNGASVEGIASLFEGVHPEALAVPLHHGHTGYGRVARGEAFTDGQDSDMSRIFWGKNRGINPAELPEGIITIRKRRG